MPVSRSGLPRRVLASRRRAELLQVLREHDDAMSVVELAAEVGMHANTVRAHLDALVQAGDVERATDARGAPGRPRQVFRATGAPSADRDYRLLAEVLTHHLTSAHPEPGQVAQEAGRGWALAIDAGSASALEQSGGSPTTPPGRPRDPLKPVLRMLSAAGFAPELADDRSVIRLRHCPFGELAAGSSAVVCQLHLGLVQGSLACLDTPVEATGISPFVQPGLCTVTLTSGVES